MENDRFSLEGKVAVVTGAGGGLGHEISRLLRSAGAEIVASDLNEGPGRAVADELGGTFVQSDVTDPDSVRALIRSVLDAHGRVDVMVNNAGIAHNVPSEEATDDDWRRVVSVNLDGVFWCCREAGKAMLEQGSGSIVNIASMSGMVSNYPQPQAAYNAAKAGVIVLTKSLAGEWAQRGVRVNAISPGYIRTNMTAGGIANEEWYRVWLDKTPMGRVADPQEIAPAALYLASEASSFTTGTNLVVDGGYTSW